MPAAVAEPVINIGPNSDPQARFLASEADITIYGGAAGGGKTFGMLLDPLQHVDVRGFRAVYFRRTDAETTKPGGLWDESTGLYPLKAGKPNLNKLLWKFPSGSRIDFDHLQYDSTCQNWRSAQICGMYYDQLETFTSYQFWYMLSRNRSVCGIRPYIKATVNPDPDSWVRKFLAWWIDDDTGYPIPERDGVIRWFIRDGDELIWASTKEELLEREGVGEDDPLSVTFIKADLFDNVDLMEKDPKYLGSLKALTWVERMRLLGGNWNVRYTSGNIFRRSIFRIVYARPHLITVARAWDLASTKKTDQNNPDWTCGTYVGLDEQCRIFIMEQVRLQEGAAVVEQAIKTTAERDGFTVPIGIEQEGGASGKGWPDSIIRNLLGGYIANFWPPNGDKVSRSKVLAAQAEVGNVYLYNPGQPGSHCQWIEEFLNEAENFPPKSGGHDDRVDSAVLGYEMCLGGFGATGWETQDNATDGLRIGGRRVPEGVFGIVDDSEDRRRRVMDELHGQGEYDRFRPDGENF